eukprot:scaffold14541_cov18-Tisochrysis_lutea.AAC.1
MHWCSHVNLQVYEQLALVQAGRHDVLGSRTYAQKAGDLAQTETQRQAAAALQQSTSLESHMRQISEADCRAKLAAGLASQLPNAVCKKEKVWSASCMKERAAVGVYPEEKC